MRAIETTATVADDGTVTIDQRVEAAPGRIASCWLSTSR
jgi:hypothetical protein